MLILQKGFLYLMSTEFALRSPPRTTIPKQLKRWQQQTHHQPREGLWPGRVETDNLILAGRDDLGGAGRLVRFCDIVPCSCPGPWSEHFSLRAPSFCLLGCQKMTSIFPTQWRVKPRWRPQEPWNDAGPRSSLSEYWLKVVSPLCCSPRCLHPASNKEPGSLPLSSSLISLIGNKEVNSQNTEIQICNLENKAGTRSVKVTYVTEEIHIY